MKSSKSPAARVIASEIHHRVAVGLPDIEDEYIVPGVASEFPRAGAAIEDVVAGIAVERVAKIIAVALQDVESAASGSATFTPRPKWALGKTVSLPSLTFSMTASPALSTK